MPQKSTAGYARNRRPTATSQWLALQRDLQKKVDRGRPDYFQHFSLEQEFDSNGQISNLWLRCKNCNKNFGATGWGRVGSIHVRQGGCPALYYKAKNTGPKQPDKGNEVVESRDPRLEEAQIQDLIPKKKKVRSKGDFCLPPQNATHVHALLSGWLKSDPAGVPLKLLKQPRFIQVMSLLGLEDVMNKCRATLSTSEKSPPHLFSSASDTLSSDLTLQIGSRDELNGSSLHANQMLTCAVMLPGKTPIINKVIGTFALEKDPSIMLEEVLDMVDKAEEETSCACKGLIGTNKMALYSIFEELENRRPAMLNIMCQAAGMESALRSFLTQIPSVVRGSNKARDLVTFISTNKLAQTLFMQAKGEAYDLTNLTSLLHSDSPLNVAKLMAEIVKNKSALQQTASSQQFQQQLVYNTDLDSITQGAAAAFAFSIWAADQWRDIEGAMTLVRPLVQTITSMHKESPCASQVLDLWSSITTQVQGCRVANKEDIEQAIDILKHWQHQYHHDVFFLAHYLDPLYWCVSAFDPSQYTPAATTPAQLSSLSNLAMRLASANAASHADSGQVFQDIHLELLTFQTSACDDITGEVLTQQVVNPDTGVAKVASIALRRAFWRSTGIIATFPNLAIVAQRVLSLQATVSGSNAPQLLHDIANGFTNPPDQNLLEKIAFISTSAKHHKEKKKPTP